MGLRDRLVGALNSDPGVAHTSVDGTERYVRARTSVVADAVIRFFSAGQDSEDPMLDEVRGWYIDGRRVHNPFASNAELVRQFDDWLVEHDAELIARLAPVPTDREGDDE